MEGAKRLTRHPLAGFPGEQEQETEPPGEIIDPVENSFGRARLNADRLGGDPQPITIRFFGSHVFPGLHRCRPGGRQHQAECSVIGGILHRHQSRPDAEPPQQARRLPDRIIETAILAGSGINEIKGFGEVEVCRGHGLVYGRKARRESGGQLHDFNDCMSSWIKNSVSDFTFIISDKCAWTPVSGVTSPLPLIYLGAMRLRRFSPEYQQ